MQEKTNTEILIPEGEYIVMTGMVDIIIRMIEMVVFTIRKSR